MVEPGTGRVLAYFGGHDGHRRRLRRLVLATPTASRGRLRRAPAGADRSSVYTLAAALDGRHLGAARAGTAPSVEGVPGSGHTGRQPGARRRWRAVPAGLHAGRGDHGVAERAVLLASTERVGAGRVIDMARAAGIDAMWVPARPTASAQRVDLRRQSAASVDPGAVRPRGRARASIRSRCSTRPTRWPPSPRAGVRGAGPLRARGSTKDFGDRLHRAHVDRGAARPGRGRGRRPDLGAEPEPGRRSCADGRPSASKTGVGRLRTSAVETAHAWMRRLHRQSGHGGVGRQRGDRVSAARPRGRPGHRCGLPAEIYRAFMDAVARPAGLPDGRVPDADLHRRRRRPATHA